MKNKAPRDERGHSLRIYDDVFDSAAYASLSPHDVLAYLAFLRQLLAYNNGDLSLPLSKAKQYGVKHHLTLARSLRALCAVGLIEITRKGGATKGGQRLATLYRVTDRDCYEIPKKGIEARLATNEWKKVCSAEQGAVMIQAYEQANSRASKLKHVGHAVMRTTTPADSFSVLTTARGDIQSKTMSH
jgi:hypothetical protein